MTASQRPLAEALSDPDGAALDEARKTNWGEQRPTYRLFKTLIDEQVHHGAEISRCATFTATATR